MSTTKLTAAHRMDNRLNPDRPVRLICNPKEKHMPNTHPIFWFSSDGETVINLAAVCSAFKRNGGEWRVLTNDYTIEDNYLTIAAEDAPSFVEAMRCLSFNPLHYPPTRSAS